MKVYINADEQYPVYFLAGDTSTTATECEVHANTVKRWRRIQAEFDHMQIEMKCVERGGEPAKRQRLCCDYHARADQAGKEVGHGCKSLDVRLAAAITGKPELEMKTCGTCGIGITKGLPLCPFCEAVQA